MHIYKSVITRYPHGQIAQIKTENILIFSKRYLKNREDNKLRESKAFLVWRIGC